MYVNEPQQRIRNRLSTDKCSIRVYTHCIIGYFCLNYCDKKPHLVFFYCRMEINPNIKCCQTLVDTVTDVVPLDGRPPTYREYCFDATLSDERIHARLHPDVGRFPELLGPDAAETGALVVNSSGHAPIYHFWERYSQLRK